MSGHDDVLDDPRVGRVRAALRLAGFFLLTVPLMPLQAINVRTSRRFARWLPHWYHRRLCQLLGVRIEIDGEIARGRPILVVANHTSWLDIPVLSAVAPVSFVAKKEVGNWPFVSTLAQLQRTVFVDRARPEDISTVTNEMAARLAAGDALVLFAEGTSSDGNRILTFRSPLFAAVKPHGKLAAGGDSAAAVQTLSIAYTRLHGIPLGRSDRSGVGWYGDMEMLGHAWALLKSGPLDVSIRIGQPQPLDGFAGRKDLAKVTETGVRAALVGTIRRRPKGESLELAAPVLDIAARPRVARGVQSGDRNWV